MGYNIKTTEIIEKRYKDKYFNNIKVLGFDFLKQTKEKKENSYKSLAFYKCQCHCGNIFSTRIKYLKNGDTKSCGCLQSKNTIIRNISKMLSDKEFLFNRIYSNYKRRSTQKKYTFELSKLDFENIIYKNCHYCGIEPSKKATNQKNTRKSRDFNDELLYNGIDRVDSNKGYTLDNIVPCCEICNKAKRDLSFEEFGNWIKRLIKYNNEF